MVILGLGSNLGDSAEQLQQAVAALKNILSPLLCSKVYETPALLPPDAPPEWNRNFLNMAVCGKTALSPRALLQAIKAIEAAQGRKAHAHWAPREIDIDILAYDDRVVKEADLDIPHAALHERDFALVPFADVAPDWTYPVAGTYFGKTARELAALLPHTLALTDIVIT